MIIMNNLTLLYAEDDAQTRENYTFVLQQYFKEVYTAKDGMEALELYKEKNPDILLLDISMPKLSGLDVAKEIRRNDEESAIVMLTAHSEQQKLLQAVNLQLEAYLIKPIDIQQFKEVLQKLIKRLANADIIYLANGFTWNAHTSTLYHENNFIKLTKKETLLIQTLIAHKEDYLLRDFLIIEIWHDEIPDASHDNKLTQLIYRFNNKLTQITKDDTPLIENRYASGYKIRT